MKMALKNRDFFAGLVFLGMYIILAMQFSNVMVYFDDYGYYSLSYGGGPFAYGTDYTFGEMMQFLRYHYMDANGRLLGFFVWLTLYWAGGLKLVQLAAAGFTTLLLYMLWKCLAQEEYPVLSALLLCAFYGVFPVWILSEGAYWFAAFFHYVAPLSALVLFIIQYFKHRKERHNLKYYGLMIVLVIMGAYSQEQIAAVVCFMLLLLMVYELYDHNVRAELFVYLAVAFICAAVIMLSPGIQDRAGDNSRGFVLTVVESTYTVIRQFYSAGSKAFIILLSVVCAVFSYRLHRKETYLLFKLMNLAAIVMAVITIMVYTIPAATALLEELTINRYYRLIVVGIPMVSLLVLQIMRYYFVYQTFQRLILFCTAVGSVGCQCFLPDVPGRLLIPTWFLLFPVLADGVFSLTEELTGNRETVKKYLLSFICMVLLVPASVEMTDTWTKYSENKAVYCYNDEQLLLAAASGAEEVHLKRIPHENYAGVQPYYEGTQYIKYWMLPYYGFENSPVFYYSENGDQMLSGAAYTQLENGIYVDTEYYNSAG